MELQFKLPNKIFIMDPPYYTTTLLLKSIKNNFFKGKKIMIINIERDKNDDMQVESNPRSDSRVSLACHQLERGRVTHEPHYVPCESWAAIANGLSHQLIPTSLH